MKSKKILLVPTVLVLALAGGSYIISHRNSTKMLVPAQQVNAESFSVKTNVTYCSPSGNAQTMDIYTPIDAKTDHPAIIHVHGGSWTSGAKSSEDMKPYLELLAKNGFVVASINYRLAPASVFPAQIADTKCAIRYMRANATKYQANTSKIGLLGESAGGHLAALAATTGSNNFDSTELTDVSNEVSAVVDLFGPANLESLANFNTLLANQFKSFIGTYSLKAASPTTYVGAGNPPFLILQGDSDLLVPPSQSQELHQKLLQNNVESELVIVKNAGHGFELVRGDAISPSTEEIQNKAVEFFQQKLK